MAPRVDPPRNATDLRTFYEHIRDGLAPIMAIAPAATPHGRADDELRASLPGPPNAAVAAMIDGARHDPRYAAWQKAIARNAAALEEVRARHEKLLQLAGADLDTPYAEF